MFRSSHNEATPKNERRKKPLNLVPKLQPALKSATLYPAERLSGAGYERKKGKESVPKD